MRDSNTEQKTCKDHAHFVGPGWTSILEKLDEKIADIAGEDYPKVKVLQVKEKFGSLRVYMDLIELPKDKWQQVNQVIGEAEKESLKTCEKCGQPGTQQGATTAPVERLKYGRVLTLCPLDHAVRDACKEAGVPFEMGNGDKVG